MDFARATGCITMGTIALGLACAGLISAPENVPESPQADSIELFEPYIPATDDSPLSYMSTISMNSGKAIQLVGVCDSVGELPEIPVEPDPAPEETQEPEPVPTEEPATEPETVPEVELMAAPPEPEPIEIAEPQPEAAPEPVAEPVEVSEPVEQEAPAEEQPQPEEQPAQPAEGEQPQAPIGDQEGAEPDYSWLTGEELMKKPPEERLALIGEMARDDYRRTGVLASITAAQFICESGMMSGGSQLANQFNNCFGIKASRTNWYGSTWNGDIVAFKTQEEYEKGKLTTIVAEFRAYRDIWQSVQDHSAYLLNTTRDGVNLRYPGISECRDPAQAIHIIKSGGYATSSTYEQTILNIVKMYDLTRFDQL